MDIIVIRKPNGDLSSTSFHVRFGSLKILQSKDQVIEIVVNGNKTALEMRLSSCGDAYFVHEDYDHDRGLGNDEDIDDDDIVNKKEDNNEFQLKISKQFQYNENIEASKETINRIPAFISNTHSNEANMNNSNTIQMNNSKIWISNSHKEILENISNSEEIFLKNLIPKENFFTDPWSILNNKNTIFLINDTLFDSTAAIPMIMSLMLYKEPLPNKKVTDLTAKTGLMYSFTSRQSITEISRIKLPNLNEDHIAKSMEKNKLQRVEAQRKKHKSFFPTSVQLKSLKLQSERNEICFVCKSSISGTQTLKAEIYLWSSDSKIIISDIDGTITKSDILGQIMPMIGSDWNHQGITELFTNIARNRYKFIYLTARALCQSQLTRDYLISLFQDKNSLPVGPMLMSPDGLFSSFKRETIDKSPHLLKISTLTEVRALFPKDYCPFYSGFGNRETDAVAYRSLGIELSKIFIINTKGEITQLNNSIKKTYSLINTIVNDLFPVISSVKEKEREREKIKDKDKDKDINE